MGCNAWNHSRSCNCGWGGVNYLSPARPALLPRVNGYGTYQSFTTPNARCPVCGDSVFFYRSPSGGVVFFDELGPPWPKHPCMESNFLHSSRNVSPPKRLATLKLECEKDGWIPVQITEITKTSSKDIVKISFCTQDSSQSIYVAHKQNFLDRLAPWLIKLNSESNLEGEYKYLIQTLASSGMRGNKVTEVELRAYSQISAAEFVRNRRRAPPNIKPNEREIIKVTRGSSKPVVHSVRLSNAERKAAVQELLIKLKEQYAVIREFRPLPSGVEKQISRKDPLFPKDILQIALLNHRNSIEYLRNLTAGGTYFQIDGTVGGQITEKQIRHAQLQIDQKKTIPKIPTSAQTPPSKELNLLKLDQNKMYVS